MKKKSLKGLNRVSVSEFKEQSKLPVVLVLDNIRSALNVGSAFRTGDAFAVEKIYLCGISATPPHREILKTAIGATQSVEWTYFDTTTAAIEALRQENYKIWAVEQAEESTSLETFDKDEDSKYAFVFGNEVSGVAQEVMDIVDGALEIPQYGTKHSLNISVSLGVVLWEMARTWRPS